MSEGKQTGFSGTIKEKANELVAVSEFTKWLDAWIFTEISLFSLSLDSMDRKRKYVINLRNSAYLYVK